MFWAKYDEATGNVLSVEDHLRSTAATCQAILDVKPHLLNVLQDRFPRFSKDEIRDFLCFHTGLHDLGKLSRSFQDFVPTMSPYETRAGPLRALHHTHAYRVLLDALDDSGILPASSTRLGGLVAWAIHHHGFVKGDDDPTATPADYFSREALDEAIRLWKLMEREFPGHAALATLRAKELRGLVFTVAGLTILSDWVASSEAFPLKQPNEATSPWTWDELRTMAAEAVAAAHIASPPVQAPSPRGLLPAGAAPRPLQRAAWERFTDFGCGQLLLVEDATGGGKTELSLGAAWHALSTEPALKGLYWGMPTKATANALHGRLKNALVTMLAGDGHFLLLHSDARTVMPLLSGQRQGARDQGIQEAITWLGQRRQSSIIHQFGLGTIDQALKGVLPIRHAALRLYGIHDKVLVFDEVHGYDEYMNRLLESLLQIASSLDLPIILLSATLPDHVKGRLLSAYSGQQHALDAAYPAATLVRRGRPDTEVVGSAATDEPPKALELVAPESVREEVDAALSSGANVAWIHNTVADAQAAYRDHAARHPGRVHLLHGRYTKKDRMQKEHHLLSTLGKDGERPEGVLWIGTQILEQSLDVDFDFMVTALAPMEAILQRIGRLHRHANPRPDAYNEARCLVSSPPRHTGPKWFTQDLGATRYVYSNVASLWGTYSVLEERGRDGFRAAQSRSWVNDSYDASDMPASFLDAQREFESSIDASAFQAHAVTRHLDGRYCDWQVMQASTRLMPEMQDVVIVDDDGTPIHGDAVESSLAIKARDVPVDAPRRRFDGFYNEMPVLPRSGCYDESGFIQP